MKGAPLDAEVGPEYAGRIDEDRHKFAALGATVGKTLPSPRIQALYALPTESNAVNEEGDAKRKGPREAALREIRPRPAPG